MKSKKFVFFTNKENGAKNIKKQYSLIKDYHNKFLKKQGVKLSSLMSRNNYTKNALVLIYLSYNYPNTETVTKAELTKFINYFHPNTSDVQQARHLAAQSGWYIDSGSRGDLINNQDKLPYGCYKLRTLKKSYPNFTQERRTDTIDNWDNLKKLYNFRCATCGSKENESHIHWPNTITKLQKGHMNPNKPLKKGNVIPQCEICNRADRNRWVYDNKGRVIALANPNVINSSSEKVQLEVFKILSSKFNKKIL